MWPYQQTKFPGRELLSHHVILPYSTSMVFISFSFSGLLRFSYTFGLSGWLRATLGLCEQQRTRHSCSVGKHSVELRGKSLVTVSRGLLQLPMCMVKIHMGIYAAHLHLKFSGHSSQSSVKIPGHIFWGACPVIGVPCLKGSKGIASQLPSYIYILSILTWMKFINWGNIFIIISIAWLHSWHPTFTKFTDMKVKLNLPRLSKCCVANGIHCIGHFLRNQEAIWN